MYGCRMRADLQYWLFDKAGVSYMWKHHRNFHSRLYTLRLIISDTCKRLIGIR